MMMKVLICWWLSPLCGYLTPHGSLCPRGSDASLGDIVLGAATCLLSEARLFLTVLRPAKQQQTRGECEHEQGLRLAVDGDQGTLGSAWLTLLSASERTMLMPFRLLWLLVMVCDFDSIPLDI